MLEWTGHPAGFGNCILAMELWMEVKEETF